MIVLTCVCVPQPGQEGESKEAARELVENSKGHEGLIGYFWNVDDANDNLIVVEVHENAASVINHIALTDFSRMGAITTVEDIRLFGDPPTPELQAALAGFGEYKVFTALS